MMPYQSYQQWQTERPKTASEQYAADVRLGVFAAGVSRSFRQAASRIRAAAGLRPRLVIRSGQVPGTRQCICQADLPTNR